MAYSNEVLNRQVCVLLSLDKVVQEDVISYISCHQHRT